MMKFSFMGNVVRRTSDERSFGDHMNQERE